MDTTLTTHGKVAANELVFVLFFVDAQLYVVFEMTMTNVYVFV